MPNRRNTFWALIIACLILGLTTERSFFFTIAYMLGAVLIGSFLWSWTAVNWVRIARFTPARRAQVGHLLNERFTVANRSIFPKLWLEVRDHSTLPNHHASRVVPTVLPLRSYAWETNTICTRRGQFTLGPMTVTSGDPFGLYQFPRRIGAQSTIIVYPLTVPVHRFAAPAGTLSGGEAVRQRTHVVTTNAAGVRDYIPGDAFNRIHWRSTMRRDRLMVKEFELDPLADVWVFLDLSRASLVERPQARANGNGTYVAGTLPPSTEEYAITVAASLVQYFVNRGRALGFVTYAPHRELVQPDRGARQLTRVLEILAVARSESERSLHDMLGLESTHLARGTTAVIVTATQDDSWLAEAHTMTRRGIRVICVLVDARSFGAPPAGPAHLRHMAESAGAFVYVVRQDDDISAALSYRGTALRPF